MTFSIIIPVYQVEKYLYQCLDSVINQSFTDYEVILIDDGSIDTSGKICDEYRMKYPNIQVIHQKHSGVSIARNNGINKAKGEYVIFIDSDDYIAKDSLKVIAKELDMQKLPDVMITKMITFNNKIIYKNHDPYLDKVKFSNKGKEEILELIFNNIYNVWPAWRYIVKRKFVESKRIRFPEGLLHEDIEWTTQILFFAESFGKMDTFWYYHRKNNSNSITNNITLQNSLDIINQIVSNLKMIQNQKCTLKTQKIFTKRLTMSLFPTLLRYFNIDKNSRKKITVLFKKNKEVFKKNNYFRYQLFLTLTDLLGLDFSLRLYRIYITMKKQIMKKNEKI